MKMILLLIAAACCVAAGIYFFDATSGTKQVDASLPISASKPAAPTWTPFPTQNPAIAQKAQAEAELAVLNVTVEVSNATETAIIGRARETSDAQIMFDGATTTAQVYQTQVAPTAAAIEAVVQANAKKQRNREELDYAMGVAELGWFVFSRVLGLMFGIVGLWKGIPRFVSWLKRMAEDEPKSEPIVIEPITSRLEVKKENSLNFYDFPCSEDDMQYIANGIVNEGRGLSYARWTPESNGFTRDTWKEIIDVLLASGLAVYRNGKNDENGYSLTGDGWDYFKQIDGKAPSPAATHSQKQHVNGA